MPAGSLKSALLATSYLVSTTPVVPLAGTLPVAESHASAGGAGTTITITKPTGTVDGDFLVAHIIADGNVSFTPPAGWTTLKEHNSGAHKQGIYWKFASGEGASWAWTLGSSETFIGGVVRVSGANALNPISLVTVGFDVVSTSAATAVLPSITTEIENTLLLHMLGCDKDVATPVLTAPGGSETVLYDLEQGGTEGVLAAMAWEDGPTTVGGAATGTKTWTANDTEEDLGIIVAINPNPWVLPEVRGTSSAFNGSGTTLDIAVPPGTVVGDVIYIFYATDGNGETHTTPSGYVAVHDSIDGISLGNTASLYRRVSDGADPSPVTLTVGSDEAQTAVAVTFKNMDNTTPEMFTMTPTKFRDTEAWSNHEIPFAPTAMSSRMVLFFETDGSDLGNEPTVPKYHTEHIHQTGSTVGASAIINSMPVLGQSIVHEQEYTVVEFEQNIMFGLLLASANPFVSAGHPYMKSYADNTADATTTVIVTPGTHVADDILLAVLTTDGASETHSLPTGGGWTVLVDGITGGSDTMSVWWKKTAGSEADVTFETGSTERLHACIIAIDDADLTVPFDVVGATDVDTNTVTGLTSLTANSLIIAIMMTNNSVSHVGGAAIAGKDHDWHYAANNAVPGYSSPIVAYTHHDTTGVEGNVTGFVPNAGVIWCSVMLACQPV